MDAASVQAHLVGTALASVAELSRPEVSGGLPGEPGLYAWWVKRDLLPRVPSPPRPTTAGWGLLYVGISPHNATSSQTLRTCVLGNHLRGNTGSSTFRYSLAALLGFVPIKKGKKYVLEREDNDALSHWQSENLRLTWAVRPQPWQIEEAVIAAMEPPLNLDDITGHPFYGTMQEARRQFRESASTRT